MRILTPQDAQAVLDDSTSWAACWKIQKGSDVLRQTNHDSEITVALGSDPRGLNGTYDPFLAFDASTVRGAADLAVDNLEVDTVLDSLGITASDVRAGLFDNVRYFYFLINWRNPTNSGYILRTGLVGNIRTFAREVANAELRGLKQYLQQVIVETYSLSCRADLGDSRCQVSLGPLTESGTITGLPVARRVFEASGIDGSPLHGADYWTGGLVTMTTGANAGYQREVKEDDGSGVLSLLEPFPADLQIGDTFTVYPGCDKGLDTPQGCQLKFDNVVNMRAEPWIPGQNALLKDPTR